jgi:hypothetical protein
LSWTSRKGKPTRVRTTGGRETPSISHAWRVGVDSRVCFAPTIGYGILSPGEVPVR